MLCAGTYPITRTLGALKDTLKEATELGYAFLFEENCVTDAEQRMWADKVCEALETKVWEKIDVVPDKYSWRSVAREWCLEMDLYPPVLTDDVYEPVRELEACQ